MNPVDILENQIDTLIKDLALINNRLAKATGNESITTSELRELGETLKANAHKAVHTTRQEDYS
jgi:hypothetical protein